MSENSERNSIAGQMKKFNKEGFGAESEDRKNPTASSTQATAELKKEGSNLNKGILSTDTKKR